MTFLCSSFPLRSVRSFLYSFIHSLISPFLFFLSVVLAFSMNPISLSLCPFFIYLFILTFLLPSLSLFFLFPPFPSFFSTNSEFLNYPLPYFLSFYFLYLSSDRQFFPPFYPSYPSYFLPSLLQFRSPCFFFFYSLFCFLYFLGVFLSLSFLSLLLYFPDLPPSFLPLIIPPFLPSSFPSFPPSFSLPP